MFNAAKTTVENRACAPTDDLVPLEELGLRLGLGQASGSSGPACKIEVDTR